MSTDILEGSVMVTRFFGGADRGTCYSVLSTNQMQYVHLTEDEAHNVAVAILADLRAAGRVS